MKSFSPKKNDPRFLQGLPYGNLGQAYPSYVPNIGSPLRAGPPLLAQSGLLPQPVMAQPSPLLTHAPFIGHPSQFIAQPNLGHSVRAVAPPVQPVAVQQFPMQSIAVQQVPVQPVAVHQAPVQSVAVHQVPVQSVAVQQVPVQTTQANLRASIKGASDIEYIPFQREYYEQVPVEKVEYVPIEKRYTDYYAIESQLEYVPYSRYETVREMVPQQKTQYVPQERVQYVPQTLTENVTVNRVQERVEYQPVERVLVHYPQYERQFVLDAERSGKIRRDLTGLSAPPVQPVAGTWNPQINVLPASYAQPTIGSHYAPSPFQSQHFGVPTPFVGQPSSFVPADDRGFLKRLEKDIRQLEASTKKEKKPANVGPVPQPINTEEQDQKAKKLLEKPEEK